MNNLYDNIRKKRARGEPPAKPGEADYPDGVLEKLAREVAEKEIDKKKKK